MDFKNKVVLVTGASAGIGAAIAEKFATNGAKLAIVGRNETKLKTVATKCKEFCNEEPLIITADVCKDEDVRRIIDATIKKYGKLDVLVNNAGVLGVNSILDKNIMEEFDRVANTNYRSVVYLTHLAVPHLIKTKGNIINMSSIAALIPFNLRTCIYGSVKAGLNHFSQCVALELASKGVRVNNVNPGPVKTGILQTNVPLETQNSLWETIANETPMQTLPDVEEVADVVLFLASNKAKSITGASYVIDSGTTLKGLMNIFTS